ncbi:helix-turn-helix domain-containing protein [Mucilaginibacter angelicae]|uniref:Helix-turn-helix domain-containing protein n=1 Tax=Mucilaginibacter angelicae TaxID=869718 RepID=A0ABV6L7A8_9SPHI
MKSEFPLLDLCHFNEHTQVIVSRFGVFLKKFKKTTFPRRHDFYHMVLFTEGSGKFSIDYQTYSIKPFQFYFMAPGQIHDWHFEGNIDGYIINFPAQFFQSFLLNANYLDQFYFFNGNVQDCIIQVPEELRWTVVELIEKAILETLGDNKFKNDTVRVLLLLLFMEISNLDGRNRLSFVEPNKNALRQNFEKLIDENYLSLRLPKQYAELLHITPNHLNKLCNEMVGISAGDLIRNRIILEAKRLLINLKLTVTEIAYKLNFEDSSYFCKLFKKQTGMTPNAFRKHHNLHIH